MLEVQICIIPVSLQGAGSAMLFLIDTCCHASSNPMIWFVYLTWVNRASAGRWEGAAHLGHMRPNTNQGISSSALQQPRGRTTGGMHLGRGLVKKPNWLLTHNRQIGIR